MGFPRRKFNYLVNILKMTFCFISIKITIRKSRNNICTSPVDLCAVFLSQVVRLSTTPICVAELGTISPHPPFLLEEKPHFRTTLFALQIIDLLEDAEFRGFVLLTLIGGGKNDCRTTILWDPIKKFRPCVFNCCVQIYATNTCILVV